MCEKTKKIQGIELEILKEFVRICEKNNLRYFLGEGTLLGAIRNEGFIPWDDDIDICMPRPDYDRFNKLAPTQLNSNYYLYSYASDDDENQISSTASQIRDRRYTIKRHFLGGAPEVTNVSIDILPLEGACNYKLFGRVYVYSCILNRKIIRCSQVDTIDTDRKMEWWKTIGIRVAKIFRLNRLNTKKIALQFENRMRKVNYDDCKYVYCSHSEYGIKTLVPKAYYDSERKSMFEDMRCIVPSNAEEILKSEYGDYMKLPPVEERVSKHRIQLIEEKES